MKQRTRPQEIIARLASEGLDFVTLADIKEKLGLTDPQAYGLVHRLTRANLIRPVKRAVYAIAPPTDWAGGEATGVDWRWAAANAIRGEPYYLAYYTAMELHEMLQHPLRTVFVAVLKHHRELRFGPAGIRFVKLAPGKFFGEEQRRVAGHVLNVAGLERTFLDCVDRPDLCGGIEEVFRGFARRHADLDPDRLLRLVYRLNKSAVTKRLGFLLEAGGYANPEVLWELERAGGKLKHFIPLDRTRAHDPGERIRRWELVANVDLKKLLRVPRT